MCVCVKIIFFPLETLSYFFFFTFFFFKKTASNSLPLLPLWQTSSFYLPMLPFSGTIPWAPWRDGLSLTGIAKAASVLTTVTLQRAPAHTVVSKRRPWLHPPQPSCPRKGQRDEAPLCDAWTQSRRMFSTETLFDFKSDNEWHGFPADTVSSHRKLRSLTSFFLYLTGLDARYCTYLSRCFPVSWLH